MVLLEHDCKRLLQLFPPFSIVLPLEDLPNTVPNSLRRTQNEPRKNHEQKAESTVHLPGCRGDGIETDNRIGNAKSRSGSHGAGALLASGGRRRRVLERLEATTAYSSGGRLRVR